MSAGSGPFRIANNQWSQFYEGMIDDVRVYNKILTAEEISQLFYHAQVMMLANELELEDVYRYL